MKNNGVMEYWRSGVVEGWALEKIKAKLVTLPKQLG
jgi:hypothetical protein